MQDSSLKTSKSSAKRSSRPARLTPASGPLDRTEVHPAVYDPFDLPDDFPCLALGEFPLKPEPFSYVHSHNCFELNYCRTGGGVVATGRKILPFEAGDAIVLPSAELHMARGDRGADSRFCVVLLDPDRLLAPEAVDVPGLAFPVLTHPEFANVIRGHEHPDLAGLVRLIWEETRGGRPGYRDAVCGLCRALAALLRRLPGATAAAGGGGNTADLEAWRRLAPALRRMLHDHAAALAMTELARSCHMSPATFRRRFHAAVGRPPLRHLTLIRMQTARRRLAAGDASVSEVAREVGYSAFSAFHRHFRQFAGCAPRACRRIALSANVQ